MPRNKSARTGCQSLVFSYHRVLVVDLNDNNGWVVSHLMGLAIQFHIVKHQQLVPGGTKSLVEDLGKERDKDCATAPFWNIPGTLSNLFQVPTKFLSCFALSFNQTLKLFYSCSKAFLEANFCICLTFNKAQHECMTVHTHTHRLISICRHSS